MCVCVGVCVRNTYYTFSVGKDTFNMYPDTQYMPKNVICNVFHNLIWVLYSEYLDYFHIELHFLSVRMRHQILLTKQAYSGVHFCANWLNVLGPSLPVSALDSLTVCLLLYNISTLSISQHLFRLQ